MRVASEAELVGNPLEPLVAAGRLPVVRVTVDPGLDALDGEVHGGVGRLGVALEV